MAHRQTDANFCCTSALLRICSHIMLSHKERVYEVICHLLNDVIFSNLGDFYPGSNGRGTFKRRISQKVVQFPDS